MILGKKEREESKRKRKIRERERERKEIFKKLIKRIVQKKKKEIMYRLNKSFMSCNKSNGCPIS